MNASRVLVRAFVALALIAPSTQVRGDGGEPTVDLDEVVVRVAPLAEGSSSAVDAPGAAATVVSAEQYAGEVRSVAELVGTAPGVAVRDYGGLGQLSTVSLRGSSADGVTVLLDGMPLNTAFGGGVNLSSIPHQWISSVEVLRGAEGARFGAGAMGGAVNIVTRRTAAGTWNAQLSSGSFRTQSAGADVAFGGERWGALLAVGADRSTGRFPYEFDALPAISGNALEPRWRENNATWSAGVLAKGFAHAAGGRWDALAQLTGGEHELPGNPHALTPSDRQEDRRAVARLRHARVLSSGLWLTGELSGRHDRLATRIAAAGREADQRDTATAARLGISVDRGWGSGETWLSAGVERLAADGPTRERDRGDVAAAASGELRLARGRVRVGPALRLERVGSFDGWSAKAGVSWAVAGPLTLRSSAGRTFRAPSFAELYLEQAVLAPNPDLQPEEAWSADAGAELRGPAGLLSVGGFAALYDDLIVYQPATFQRYQPFNSGRSRIVGLECEAATRPYGPAALVTSAAYTFMRTALLRGEEDVLGNEVPHRPAHRLFARVAASRGRLAAHLDAQWLSAQWADTRNRSRIPEAVTLGAGASLGVLRSAALRVHLELRNLLDRRDLQDGFGNPLPGRVILVGLRAGSTAERGAP